MWHNQIPITPSKRQFNHQDKILSVGSCFADEMATRLTDLHFDLLSNPFGVLYNPVSLSNIFGYLRGRLVWDENASFLHENKWRHLDFHSRVSRSDREGFVNNINDQLKRGTEQLREASLIIITFGTAFVWEQLDGTVVGNCHKLPSSQFNRRLLTTEEIRSSLLRIMEDIRSVNTSALVLFTVSPVRHSRDGMINNNWSKARLLDACHTCSSNNDSIQYFPSYEIQLDELRDYRFYDRDRMHPSKEAVDYIFSRFFQTYFSNVSEELIRLIKKINGNLAHRPIDIGSKSYRKHVVKTEEMINDLKERFEVHINS